jgi:hypothetical protein
MAISFVGSSTSFGSGQSSFTVALPTGRANGDMLVIFIGGKQYNATIGTPSGWTSIGTSTNGTTNAGVDTGSTKLQAFYRIADGTELSTISFGISSGDATNNVFMGELLIVHLQDGLLCNLQLHYHYLLVAFCQQCLSHILMHQT